MTAANSMSISQLLTQIDDRAMAIAQARKKRPESVLETDNAKLANPEMASFKVPLLSDDLIVDRTSIQPKFTTKEELEPQSNSQLNEYAHTPQDNKAESLRDDLDDAKISNAEHDEAGEWSTMDYTPPVTPNFASTFHQESSQNARIQSPDAAKVEETKAQSIAKYFVGIWGVRALKRLFRIN